MLAVCGEMDVAFADSLKFGDGLKFRTGDKTTALGMLGDHLGLFQAGDVSATTEVDLDPC
jgi:hypothetical protein